MTDTKMADTERSQSTYDGREQEDGLWDKGCNEEEAWGCDGHDRGETGSWAIVWTLRRKRARLVVLWYTWYIWYTPPGAHLGNLGK